MKKFYLLILLITAQLYSYEKSSKLLIGATLPLGAEVGFINEANIPESKYFKGLIQGYCMWSPLFEDGFSSGHVISLNMQPGFRLTCFNNFLKISAGFSLNGFLPLPADIFIFGIGPYHGYTISLGEYELGITGTLIVAGINTENPFGWLSLTFSRGFPVLKNKK